MSKNNSDVQKHLARAARALRRTIAATEAAYRAAEEDSDDELRCSEAIEELKGALWHFEWSPEIGEAFAERLGTPSH